MVDQLADELKLFDAALPEQVLEVPKILCPSRPLRAALAATQMAEQLVDVPVPSMDGFEEVEVDDEVEAHLRQLLEQTVDIPVPLALLQGASRASSSPQTEEEEKEEDDVLVFGCFLRSAGTGFSAQCCAWFHSCACAYVSLWWFGDFSHISHYEGCGCSVFQRNAGSTVDT